MPAGRWAPTATTSIGGCSIYCPCFQKNGFILPIVCKYAPDTPLGTPFSSYHLWLTNGLLARAGLGITLLNASANDVGPIGLLLFLLRLMPHGVSQGAHIGADFSWPLGSFRLIWQLICPWMDRPI